MTTERILTYAQIEELWHEYEDFEDFACAIEQAVLQSPEVRALRKDADLYRRLKSVCVTSTDFTGTMQSDDPERWCVLRRKDGIISSFTDVDLDYGVRAAMEQQT